MRIVVAGLTLAVVVAYTCSISYYRRLWAKSPGSQSKLFAFERNGRVGFIDRKGKVVIPPTIKAPIEEVGDFSDGLARVNDQGYIDQTGRWAIKRQLWSAYDYADGLAWVRVDGAGDRADHELFFLTGRAQRSRPARASGYAPFPKAWPRLKRRASQASAASSRGTSSIVTSLGSRAF